MPWMWGQVVGDATVSMPPSEHDLRLVMPSRSRTRTPGQLSPMVAS